MLNDWNGIDGNNWPTISYHAALLMSHRNVGVLCSGRKYQRKGNKVILLKKKKPHRL